MGTAQVFQAARANAVSAGQMPGYQQAIISMGQERPELDLVNDGWWNTGSGRVAGSVGTLPQGMMYEEGIESSFTPNADKAFYAGLDPYLSGIGKQARLTANDWNGALGNYFQTTGSNENDVPWWGPIAKSSAYLTGLENLYPSLRGVTAPLQTPEARAAQEAQQSALGQSMMARQQANGGGGFFGDLAGILGDIGPLLTIGSLFMGGFDPSSLMSFLGGGEALATGGMSFAPEAFSSAFIPSASVAAGGMSGLPSFLSGAGAGAGLSALGGEDFSQYFNGAANPSGEGVTSAGGPLANGMGGQFANFLQQNPWAKNLFGGVKGAFSNQQNPLAGALMGYANSMMPGTGGPFSNALGMGSGITSLFQGMDVNRRQRSAFDAINNMSDPFAGMRADAMSRLAALNADPSGTLGNTPGYKAGMDAITRQRAAMGQLGSGNLATALLDYGGNIFNQERNSAMNQISAAGDPARLAMIKAQLASQTGAGNPAIMNGLATLGFGLNRMGL